jgi:hypothetical protein
MIDCRSGADINAPLAVSYAQAVASKVEVCRNDECYSGTWPPLGGETPGPGSGSILTLPVRRDEMAPFIQVILIWRDNDGPLLQVQWNPGSGPELHAGDRYRVTLTNGGRALLAIDERVDAYDVVSPLPARCMVTCMHKTFQLDDKGRCVNCEGGADADAGN